MASIIMLESSSSVVFCRTTDPLMGALLETHIKRESGPSFIHRLLPNWISEDNFIPGESNRIMVFSDPFLSVVTYHKSDQMIVCGVFFLQFNHYFTVSFIYAMNCPIQRRRLWQELSDLKDSSPISSRPWLLVGDFNQILSKLEHSSIPQTTAPTSGMNEMRSCFDNIAVKDITAR